MQTNFVEGDWHVDVISDVLLQYEAPRTYIEIGVRSGTSFNAQLAHAECHGVDIDDNCYKYITGGDFYHMGSDEFFDTYRGAKAHTIFIDGDHSYEQAKKDFEGALRHVRSDGTIILHDTWPVRQRNENLCGTVWRLARDIRECVYGVDTYTYTYRKFPGLTLVQFPQSVY